MSRGFFFGSPGRGGLSVKVTRFTLGCLVLAACLGLAGTAQAADVFVSKSGNDTTGDGSQANPYLTIQEGYLQADVDDRVIVGPGTYNECVFASNFQTLLPPGQDKPITLVSQDWLDNQDNTTTIITGLGLCDGNAIERAATVTIGSTNSRLEGFTIQEGGEAGVNAFGSVVITNNVIENSTSEFGGGIFFYSANCYFGESTTEISNNTVQNNEAFFNFVDTVGGDGGGIYLDVRALVPDPLSTCNFLGDSTVTVDGNTVQNNALLATNPRITFGGGIFAVTNTGVNDQGNIGEALVNITNNTVTGNTMTGQAAGYGGGIFVTTYGFGREVITVDDNDVNLNLSVGSAEAPGDGGGISAWIQTADTPQAAIDHTVTVSNNDVVGNDAQGNGGGIDLFLIAESLTDIDASQRIIAVDNTIVDNTSGGLEGGGGGMLATSVSQRTAPNAAGTLGIDLFGNRISDNTSTNMGGGLGLLITADGDPVFDPGNTAPATAEIIAERNLIANNTVTSAAGSGGGIFMYVESYGPGTATATIDRATIADNSASNGGGIELESRTDFDVGGSDEGVNNLNLVNSIVSDNGTAEEIGGPQPGVEDGFITIQNNPPAGNTGNFNVSVATSDVFNDGGAGLYAFWVGDRTGQNGNISADPQLSTDNLFIPGECSPTVDAADAGTAFFLEPAPNGGRANMGHTGNTDAAQTGLIETNGDNVVDGRDILTLSAAFGSSNTDGWFDALADADDDGDVDGDDLARIASDFGKSCP